MRSGAFDFTMELVRRKSPSGGSPEELVVRKSSPHEGARPKPDDVRVNSSLGVALPPAVGVAAPVAVPELRRLLMPVAEPVRAKLDDPVRRNAAANVCVDDVRPKPADDVRPKPADVVRPKPADVVRPKADEVLPKPSMRDAVEEVRPKFLMKGLALRRSSLVLTPALEEVRTKEEVRVKSDDVPHQLSSACSEKMPPVLSLDVIISSFSLDSISSILARMRESSSSFAWRTFSACSIAHATTFSSTFWALAGTESSTAIAFSALRFFPAATDDAVLSISFEPAPIADGHLVATEGHLVAKEGARPAHPPKDGRRTMSGSAEVAAVGSAVATGAGSQASGEASSEACTLEVSCNLTSACAVDCCTGT